jgi:dTDP-4-dehydrorhamnose 3,5-epimerase
MKVETAILPGVRIITSRIFSDERGFFNERSRIDVLRNAGIEDQFVQLNHSRSLPGVIRGLHGQRNPAQAKLVTCLNGKILDVVVDARRDSSTYGKSFTCELSGENGKTIYIPAGYLHGFCVLDQNPADVIYQVDGYYHAAGEFGVRFDDPNLNIKWPIENPIVSGKDRALPLLKEL